VKCPRCQLDLTRVSSVIEADLCSECEGLWLSREALERCLTLPREYLRNSPLWVSLEADHPDVPLDPLISCPSCEKQMERHYYDGKSSTVVDACPEHGVWLDDGELSKILDYTEHTRQKAAATSTKGSERVHHVSSGVWQKLARWFGKLKVRTPSGKPLERSRERPLKKTR
jgi:Zn-finger nucleic acid-binding protein